jgi:hypothetical protein
MAKYHFLTGDDLLAMDEADRIARCVQIKADVVAADEREGGRRALLNYGHTLAHALEIEQEHTLAHGEAVAIGLVYAAHLAHVLGRIDERRVQQHYAVVRDAYGLGTSLPAGADHERLVALMGRDKKALDSLTFVLDGDAGVEVVPGVDPHAAHAALAAMDLAEGEAGLDRDGGLEGVQRLGEIVDQRLVQCVERVRPIERDEPDLAAGLDEDVLVGHGGLRSVMPVFRPRRSGGCPGGQPAGACHLRLQGFTPRSRASSAYDRA